MHSSQEAALSLSYLRIGSSSTGDGWSAVLPRLQRSFEQSASTDAPTTASSTAVFEMIWILDPLLVLRHPCLTSTVPRLVTIYANSTSCHHSSVHLSVKSSVSKSCSCSRQAGLTVSDATAGVHLTGSCAAHA